MLKLYSKKVAVLLSSLLCVTLYTCASEACATEERRIAKFTQEVYAQHYGPFETYVFSIQNKLWWGRKFCSVSIGAKAQGYDDFVIETCIPESYSLFDREKKDIKNILQKVGSQENIIHVDLLLHKCSEKPKDINFIARTTYDEGKRLEQLLIENGYAVSEDDRDTFVAAGLFVRYWMEHRHSLE